MNKIIATTVILLTFFTISAQEKIEKKENEYNRWSVEVNIGNNKPIKPFSEAYATSADNVYLKSPKVNHFDIGVRRMFSTKFGLKFDLGTDIIENLKESSSLPFHTVQNIATIQAVFNIGKLFGFDEFTHTFGILTHIGFQASQLNGKTGTGIKKTEYNGGIVYGITPQVRLSNRFSVSADVSSFTNTRQHLNWDGNYANISDNLTGKMIYIKLGATYYLGKNKNHADWFSYKKIANSVPGIENKMDSSDSLKDTDKDGIVDTIDLQNNTPNGVAVDRNGRFIDINNNNVPDELEPKPEKTKVEVIKESQTDSNTDVRYVNIYYGVNKDLPNSDSENDLNYVIQYLKTHPNAKVILTGYADEKGNVKSNIKLSINRSENLKKVIISKGVDVNRITTIAKGVDKTSTVKDEASLAKSRRVSVIIE